MPELLTPEFVVAQLRDLAAAHPVRLDEKALVRRADVYYRGLEGLTGEALKHAVKKSLQTDKFFPKIARLRELALAYTLANHPTVMEINLERPSGWCDGCQSVAREQRRWRPRIDRKGRRILDGAGRLWLEQYTRVVCKCNPLCRYQPDDEGTEYMTDKTRPQPAAAGA